MKTIDIEISIYKKFKKDIWRRFLKGIKEYKLINKNDKIMVCISGGKDSMLLAMCIKRLQQYGPVSFEAEYVVMDPGYNKENIELIKTNMKHLEIPIKVYKSDIFNTVKSMDMKKAPCYMCARMRRGYLYSYAQEIGCNKIALGHHFDDVIETILLSMIYGGETRTMMPKLHSTNFEGMQLIRPLYYVKEESIIKWKKYNGLKFIGCACELADSTSVEKDSKRKEMKELVSKFRNISPMIDMNIFRSSENINLGAILGYKNENKRYHFLDDYSD